MAFSARRDKSDAVLRKALKTRNLRDRDLLLTYARELNEIAMDGEGQRRRPVRPTDQAQPVTPEMEAVARRMCLAFHLDWRGEEPTRWDALVDDQWTDYLVEARAAVEALLAVSPDPRVSAYLRSAIGAGASVARTRTPT